jgi:putative MFS transporter
VRGVSVVNSVGRLSSAGIQFVVVGLFNHFGIAAVTTFLVSALLIQAVALLLLGRETRGHSLEDIELAPDVLAASVPQQLHA